MLENNPSYNIWRYLDLLPIDDHDELPPVQVGWTPLYKADELAERLGIRKLYIKDEGRNPTGSIKDRGSAVAVATAIYILHKRSFFVRLIVESYTGPHT